MPEKLCSVNNKGEFTFIVDGVLPENVPKIKHPLRELHPDYKNFLQQNIAERVKLKKQLIKERQSNEKKLLEFERERLVRYKRNIIKWFNV